MGHALRYWSHFALINARGISQPSTQVSSSFQTREATYFLCLPPIQASISPHLPWTSRVPTMAANPATRLVLFCLDFPSPTKSCSGMILLSRAADRGWPCSWLLSQRCYPSPGPRGSRRAAGQMCQGECCPAPLQESQKSPRTKKSGA